VAAFFSIDSITVTQVVANTTITVAGDIKAPNGAAIRRKVLIFSDNNMTTPLAITESTLPSGAFSTTVNGLPMTRFTVIAKAAKEDENDVIYAHVRVF